MAHGLDHYVAGMNTIWSSTPRDTVSSQLLKQAGMSPATAGLIDNSVRMVGNIGGTAILSITRTATYSLPTKTMGQITKNEVRLVGNATESANQATSYLVVVACLLKMLLIREFVILQNALTAEITTVMH